MEEEMEMEARRQEEARAKDENRKRTRKTSLQLGSMIVQWIVLLACLILFGLCYLRSPGPDPQSPSPQPEWIYIKPSNQSVVYKNRIGIKRKDGTMELNDLNHSIPIHCDGLYLFFLKGTINLQGAKGSLTLKVYSQPNEDFLVVNFSHLKTEVEELIVHKFRSKDEVYLKYDSSDHETAKQDLTLSLIMLTPRSYCSPGH